MKKNRASKSWLCFQAKSIEDDHVDSDFSVTPGNDNMQKIPSVSSETSLSKMSSKSSTRSSRRRSRYRRTFSKIVKAVFFETSLKNSKKVGQDPYQGLRTSVSSSKKQEKEGDESYSNKDLDAVSKASYTSSSVSCSSTSCSSSSSSSNLSNLAEQRKSFQSVASEFQESTQREIIKNPYKNPYSTLNGLCLLVVALSVLAVWGRICAIICTSIWIYFGSIKHRREDKVTVMSSEASNSKPREEEEEMESKEYKKRVIMGGLLERKHSRI